MPLFYDLGMVKEHLWVRNSCGIFDVSHMGQIFITGSRVEELLSTLTPTNFRDTEVSKAKYTALLNENCGIIDDIIATKLADDKYFVVINAARKDVDIPWIKKHLADFNCELEILDDRSLIAVQGQHAEAVLAELISEDVKNVQYMSLSEQNYNGTAIYLSRTGYTGEDGFEISAPNNVAAEIWNKLLEFEQVKPIGLGARDSLRLEMGYPLYGHELTEETNLGEATLKWIISSNDNFIGKDKLTTTPSKRRVGVKLIDKGIARDGMKIFTEDRKEIGLLTSAGFSPTLNCSIGQAILDIEYAKKDTPIFIEVRDKLKEAVVTKISLLPANTKK